MASPLRLIWLVPPLLLAVCLRGIGLGRQILTGDELHAVNAALARTPGEILSNWTYHGADYSVPLALLYRGLLDTGVSLSELWFRAPVLLASLLSVLILPRAFAPRIGARAATLLGWLLAISPLLVLYGRMVRSYAPMLLVAVGAVLAFEAWWRRGERRMGKHGGAGMAVAYAGLAAGAICLHLGAASFVLAPFVWAGLGLALRRPPELLRGFQRLARLAVGTGLATALLLWPARESILAMGELHGAGAWPSLSTWLDVLRLHAGSASWIVALLVLALGVRGFAQVYHRDRSFAGFALCLLAVHLLGLAIASPYLLHELLVVNRYLLVWLPFALAFVAVGLAEPWPGFPRPAPARLATPALVGVLLLLFAAGPLARERFRKSSFVHSPSSLTFSAEPDRVVPEALPAFYRDLAKSADGERSIVEVPWMNVASHAFDAYQAQHGRALRVASLNRLHADPRLALRNTLAPEPQRLLDSDVRYVVVHTDLRQEEVRVDSSKMLFRERLEESKDLWSLLRGAGGRLAARFEQEWGAPVYADAEIRVWDLERVRQSSSSRSSLIRRSARLRVAAHEGS